MNFPHNKIKINSVLLMMSLTLTIKVVAFFLGHPVYMYSRYPVRWASLSRGLQGQSIDGSEVAPSPCRLVKATSGDNCEMVWDVAVTVYVAITRCTVRATSIRQAPVLRHLRALRKSPMEVYHLDEWIIITLHVAGFLYIQQYFNTSITVLSNQVWKLLIALFKVPNTGAFTGTWLLRGV